MAIPLLNAGERRPCKHQPLSQSTRHCRRSQDRRRTEGGASGANSPAISVVQVNRTLTSLDLANNGFGLKGAVVIGFYLKVL